MKDRGDIFALAAAATLVALSGRRGSRSHIAVPSPPRSSRFRVYAYTRRTVFTSEEDSDGYFVETVFYANGVDPVVAPDGLVGAAYREWFDGLNNAEDLGSARDVDDWGVERVMGLHVDDGRFFDGVAYRPVPGWIYGLALLASYAEEMGAIEEAGSSCFEQEHDEEIEVENPNLDGPAVWNGTERQGFCILPAQNATLAGVKEYPWPDEALECVPYIVNADPTPTRALEALSRLLGMSSDRLFLVRNHVQAETEAEWEALESRFRARVEQLKDDPSLKDRSPRFSDRTVRNWALAEIFTGSANTWHSGWWKGPYKRGPRLHGSSTRIYRVGDQYALVYERDLDRGELTHPGLHFRFRVRKGKVSKPWMHPKLKRRFEDNAPHFSRSQYRLPDYLEEICQRVRRELQSAYDRKKR